ncbi:hypothetical protein N9W89_14075 [Hellea sp.]|nr:hypothetical protein [Hellea sp.]
MTTSKHTSRLSLSKAGRALWGSLVVLATLGGVLGVYQFFTDNGPNKEAAPQTMVLRMVESGDLSADEAASLMEMLGSSTSEQAVETLKSGTDLQKEALQLVAVAPTFERGIVILESEAKTTADWKLIAELSLMREPSRAVEAARKAIALAPQDYDALRMLVKAQIFSGDFADAKRSQASLQVLASTPLQHLKAAIMGGDIASITQRPEEAEIAISILSEAISDLEPLEELQIDPSAASPVDGALLTASEAVATRGQLNFITEEFEKVEPDMLRAVALAERSLDGLSGRNLNTARKSLALYHDLRATAKHRLDQIDDHHEAHEKAIAQFRAMADSGDAEAKESLPTRLMSLAREYARLGEPDIAIDRMSEAIKRFDDYAADFPNNREIEDQRLEMTAWMQVLSGNIDGAKKTYDVAMKNLRTGLLAEGDPQQLRQVTELIYKSMITFNETKDPTPSLLTYLHVPGVQTLSAFERRYGPSKEVDLERYRVRLNYIGTLLTAKADPAEIQTASRELIVDLSSAQKSEVEIETLEIYKLYALSLLVQAEPEDHKTIAQEGLDLANSLNIRGKLGTNEQRYIAFFEAELKNGE